jgi:hypothetical protein
MIANISLSYNPNVHRFLPMTTMAGIEYLSIEFPLTTYPGHLMVSLISLTVVTCVEMVVMLWRALSTSASSFRLQHIQDT